MPRSGEREQGKRRFAKHGYIVRVASRMAGRGRVALLVIHGIGQQRPLSTLARLTQGLMTDAHRRGTPWRAEAVVVAGAAGAEPLLRLRAHGNADTAGFERVDVTEFAWQRLVAGRVGSWAVLQWLWQTGLAPLHVRRSWRLLANGGASPWGLVLRHVLIASSVLLVLLILLFAVALGVVQVPRLLPGLLVALAEGAARLAWPTVAGMALTLVAALVAASMVWGLLADALEVTALRRAQLPWGWAGGYAGALRAWVPAALLGVLALGALAILAGSVTRSGWLVLAASLAPLASTPALLTSAVAALGLMWSWGLVRSYVGDIALYVKGPADSPFGRTRACLQRALVAQLRELIRERDEEGYAAVVLVGHSLGSVLALDALDILAAEAGAGEPLALRRLRGLFTFGSPLDKVAYFFRERIDDGEAVHAQVASFWRGARRRHDLRDPGPFRVEMPEASYDWLRWWHLHAPLDPISDPLSLYRVDARHTLRGITPWGAHQAYWHDPRCYALLRALLEELAASTGGAAQVAAAVCSADDATL